MEVVQLDAALSARKGLAVQGAVTREHGRVLDAGRQFGGQAVALARRQDQLGGKAFEQRLFERVPQPVAVQIRARGTARPRPSQENKNPQSHPHRLILPRLGD